ncbi:TetR family transcriptional regulator C-terminal domain-containing protein [Microbispora sp. NPDC049125]|uniref:TetR family transcriptional regulator C-terminal domain-containing protein n=1 Tax=Microbispora sp. NPDC049125 TaxID=3154929 RepID=UPI0034659C1B
MPEHLDEGGPEPLEHEQRAHDLQCPAFVPACRHPERIEAAAVPATPRALLRAVLAELLPLDEERRTRALVHAAYFVRSLNDERLAALFRDAPPALEELAAALIVQARDDGGVAPGVDPRREADLLLATVDGLQTSMLLGHHDVEEALALVDYQLGRIFADGG